MLFSSLFENSTYVLK